MKRMNVRSTCGVRFFVVLLSLLGWSGAVQGQYFLHWTNWVNNDWGEEENWYENEHEAYGPPTLADEAYVVNTAYNITSMPVVSQSNACAGYLHIQSYLSDRPAAKVTQTSQYFLANMLGLYGEIEDVEGEIFEIRGSFCLEGGTLESYHHHGGYGIQLRASSTFLHTGGTHLNYGLEIWGEVENLFQTADATGEYILQGGTLTDVLPWENPVDPHLYLYTPLARFIHVGGYNSKEDIRVGLYGLDPSEEAAALYELSGTGTVTSTEQYVGYQHYGTFSHHGGTTSGSEPSNTTTTLYVGCTSNGTGLYNMHTEQGETVAPEVTTTTAYIGYGGSGNFQHAAGTHVSDTLRIADGLGDRGRYSLSGGTLSASNHEYVGYRGTMYSLFNQTGGTNKVAADKNIYLAYESSQIDDSPPVYSEPLGTYTQSGGYTEVGGSVYLAYSSYGTGSYTLSGGRLKVGALMPGSGTGTFTFTGGTLDPDYVYLDELTNSSGVLSPDGENAVGTVAFDDNDYTQEEDGVYYVDITSDTDCDLISSDEHLTFDGTVYINLVGDTPAGQMWSGTQIFYIATGGTVTNLGLVTAGENAHFYVDVVDIGGGEEALRLRWVDTSCE